MKKILAAFLLGISLSVNTPICSANPPVPAVEQGINLVPVKEQLLKSLPPAIMAGPNITGELPEKLDIGSHVMIARSQGSLGSCASWSVVSELTRAERIRNNWPVGKNLSYFSASYNYNQVNGGVDMGSSLYSNLQLLVDKGCSLYVTFPYIEDFRIQPPLSAHREAARYRIQEFKTLPAIDPETIKSALVKWYGVIVSFHVFENFDNYTGGIYRPGGHSGVDRSNGRFDFHGMLILGFDDNDRTFKILNSWGTYWGDNGYMYISYDDVKTLIREAYIMIPKASLPTEAMPPSHVQAGKGSNKNKVVISWERNNTREYEVFRLGENELYISLGKTTKNYFEDTNVVPEQHYFYFVAAHAGEYMSELSLASEGWCHEKAVEVPGVPREFSVSLQENTLIARWEAVEDAELYQVYRFDEGSGSYVLQGETMETIFRAPLPNAPSGPVLTYFVIAKNRYGQSLPSEPASVTIDEWKNPEDDEEVPEDKEIYKGGFYSFSPQKFLELERRAAEYFEKRQAQFRQSSQAMERKADEYFNRMRNSYLNKFRALEKKFGYKSGGWK
jgi:hypothetical protein